MMEDNMVTTFKDTPPTLKEAQKIVGGYVEIVFCPYSPDLQLLVNENGLGLSLPLNPEASLIAGQNIVGPAIVLEDNALWD